MTLTFLPVSLGSGYDCVAAVAVVEAELRGERTAAGTLRSTYGAGPTPAEKPGRPLRLPLEPTDRPARSMADLTLSAAWALRYSAPFYTQVPRGGSFPADHPVLRRRQVVAL
ncbi:hypothetical protein QMK17_03465 [Rhodococcus sp. G-MC3]|uniref:hypothetical protein n=1 Tax=Rhodococcus sp. G-MC3 TaxID=3046209 RepID=UPI0024B8F7B8|nr:hypothetical protein [Rhodococcus sp. G-MC3]MDJ0392392.1 hypothetical protein [Rhodococcus sp. G-MC3]